VGILFAGSHLADDPVRIEAMTEGANYNEFYKLNTQIQKL